jgi:hypothetical protein
MTCVIKDRTSGEYYCQRPTGSGWFHPDIERAKIYTAYVYAGLTIDAGGHHVTHPGSRDLVIVRITITEEDTSDYDAYEAFQNAEQDIYNNESPGG